MKRLLVTCDFPPVPGGQASYFGCLWKDLPAQDNHLLLPREADSGQQLPNVSFMPVPHGELWPVRATRFGVLLLYTFLTALRIQAAEIHFGQLVTGGLCGVAMKVLLGKRVVVHAHGADVREFSRSAMSARLLRIILGCADRVVVNSRNTADAVTAAGRPGTQVYVVNPGVEKRFFSDDHDTVVRLRKQLSLHDKTVVITVGRLVERKGHDTVIRSFGCLRPAHPDLCYLIVGFGPYRATLERLARENGVSDMVIFCDSISDEDLPSYYRLARLFVMPSRYLPEKGDIEGFGVVYLEANAAGLPVVAGRSGGVEDAVRHEETGLLVDNPSNANEVGEAVVRLLNDQALYRSLSKGARNWAEEHRCERMRDIWLNLG